MRTGIKKGVMGMKMGRKGVAVVAIAAVLITAVLIIEGIIVANFVADIEIVKRTTRELAVINAVDAIEFAKKALQQAVPYSFYKASYDVLEKGGYCASDDNSCAQQCKIPYSIPTRECDPWWRVYDNTYEIDSSTFETYLSNRIASIYDDYASLFFGPDYCPQPPGNVITEDKGEYKVHVYITNIEGGVIEYKSDNLEIVEHTVGFNDGFDASTFELFEFAKDTFIDNDKIKSDFNSADNKMADEGCKNIYLRDFCESDVGLSEESHILFCEEQLSIHCSESSRNDPCDFDNDNTITADEKYNCKVREEFENPVLNNDGTFEASASIDDCIKVGHDARFSGQKIEFGDERWVEDCDWPSSYIDVRCDYDYFGTASAVGQVKDVKNSYPIDSSWTTITASFRIASGNVAECGGQDPIETSEYVEDENSLCCPAITTNELDKAAGCKIQTNLPIPSP